MPAEIKMPQLSDTMSEGTVVKWNKKEGDAVKAGEELADIETDKATMPMESPASGTLAVVAIEQGGKAKVGALIAVIATGKENPADIKKQYAAGAARAPAVAVAKPAPAKAATPAKSPAPGKAYQYDIIVIGGGPAGYAAAIRAGQLGKRVLCIEKENLGGTCLNWGCIPTKALLEDGAFVLKVRTEAAEHGVAFENLKIDFAKIISRSRGVANKLQRGIGGLFNKYGVKHEIGIGTVLGAHRVRLTSRNGPQEVTAEHIIIATGARPTPMPGVEFDGKAIITSREAMILPQLPKRMAIIGAGAIGCEFGDIYSALGAEVTIIEMLPHLLPNEDEDVSVLLERIFIRRGIDVRVGTKVERVEKTDKGVKLTLSGGTPGTLEADVLLVAIGVTGNTDAVAAPESKLAIQRSRVVVDPEYRTNLENVWGVGDCVMFQWPDGSGMDGVRHPDLAHVAHHEAVTVVDRICGHEREPINYRQIPGCTYTHPQVASMGPSEKKLREMGRELRVGKFPFSASGRALAAGESQGFVKLIFDAKIGELLGVHMIGENVTELLSELVLARKLEATEDEILDAIHPHPTLSEAIMEAAGVARSRAIHL